MVVTVTLGRWQTIPLLTSSLDKLALELCPELILINKINGVERRIVLRFDVIPNNFRFVLS